MYRTLHGSWLFLSFSVTFSFFVVCFLNFIFHLQFTFNIFLFWGMHVLHGLGEPTKVACVCYMNTHFFLLKVHLFHNIFNEEWDWINLSIFILSLYVSLIFVPLILHFLLSLYSPLPPSVIRVGNMSLSTQKNFAFWL